MYQFLFSRLQLSNWISKFEENTFDGERLLTNLWNAFKTWFVPVLLFLRRRKNKQFIWFSMYKNTNHEKI